MVNINGAYVYRHGDATYAKILNHLKLNDLLDVREAYQPFPPGSYPVDGIDLVLLPNAPDESHALTLAQFQCVLDYMDKHYPHDKEVASIVKDMRQKMLIGLQKDWNIINWITHDERELSVQDELRRIRHELTEFREEFAAFLASLSEPQG
jgi:hypothetical protein